MAGYKCPPGRSLDIPGLPGQEMKRWIGVADQFELHYIGKSSECRWLPVLVGSDCHATRLILVSDLLLCPLWTAPGKGSRTRNQMTGRVAMIGGGFPLWKVKALFWFWLASLLCWAHSHEPLFASYPCHHLDLRLILLFFIDNILGGKDEKGKEIFTADPRPLKRSAHRSCLYCSHHGKRIVPEGSLCHVVRHGWVVVEKRLLL